jgi:hypothetical protein
MIKAMVMVAASALVSCSPFYMNYMGYENLSMPLGEAWIKTSGFRYLNENHAYIKSPFEFERDGGGDCEDFAIYMVYLLGPKASGIVIKAGEFRHMIVRYDNLYIEPQVHGMYYDKYKLEIIEVLDYFLLMKYSTSMGTKKLGKEHHG